MARLRTSRCSCHARRNILMIGRRTGGSCFTPLTVHTTYGSFRLPETFLFGPPGLVLRAVFLAGFFVGLAFLVGLFLAFGGSAASAGVLLSIRSLIICFS